MFTLNGRYKWVDELPRLVSDYNARKHRTIGMRPVDVTPAIAERLVGTVYSAIKIAGPAKFKVGDSVRVSKCKTVFEKGCTPNRITEVFTIVKGAVQRTNPVTYHHQRNQNISNKKPLLATFEPPIVFERCYRKRIL
ncbi:hypothetical protein ALC57_16856 [Trachymyrmex cornetzi]|uniref:Integrase catalytic domain-containing protein n=1 Tax=Trachymyrmex cornetzi TaxID=471704 RepID=A0A151IU94_9HYME|nr:hypothetical protein ALC57_16856 [Trachymyrmex cornetzi]